MVTVRNLEWAAGFIEGEGCFHWHKRGSRAEIRVAQVQREPLERLQHLFRGHIYLRKSSRPTWQPVHVWAIYRSSAIGLAMTLYSLLSPRRRSQSLAVIQSWRASPLHPRYRKTCPHGHPWTPSNTRIQRNHKRKKKQKVCKMCRAMAARGRRRLTRENATSQLQMF